MKLLTKIGIWLLGLAGLGLVLVMCWPIAEWYLSFDIALGVDFPNMVSYVSQLSSQLRWPLVGWKSSTFAGMPWGIEYPSLHMYLTVPWARVWGPYIGLQYYLIFNVAIFLAGSYILFWRLSRNFLVAGLLSLAVGYSVNVYGALIWGGSIPSFATQAFFPWVLWSAWNWLNGDSLARNKNWFVLTMILIGLSLWGHPLISFMYIIPAVGILGLFSKWKGRVKEKIVWGVLLVAGVIIIGLPQVEKNIRSGWQSLVSVDKELDPGKVASSGKEGVTTPEEVKAFYRQQPGRLVDETQTGIWVVLVVSCGLWVVSWAVSRGFGSWGRVIPWAVWAGWLVLYIWIYGEGISIYHGGWYRVFWAVPTSMGALGAIIWGQMEDRYLAAIKRWWWHLGVRIALIGVIGGMGFVGYRWWSGQPAEKLRAQMVIEDIERIDLHKKKLVDKWYRPLIEKQFLRLMEARQTWASAYPDVINQVMNKEEMENLRKQLAARQEDRQIDLDNTNFRLYTADQMVNMWWPTYFEMPLARGYVDPTFDKDGDRGMLFWLDASVNKGADGDPNEMVGSFEVPEEAANNQTKFLVDWYGIGHLLGNYATDNPTALTPFLIGEKEEAEKVNIQFKPIYRMRVGEDLTYYTVAKEETSPIAVATNTETMLVIAKESGYEAVIRALGTLNWNSRVVIPIRGGERIDKWSIDEMNKFDVVYMTEYNYDMSNYNKVWNNLTDYVESGGKLIVDTGGEVKESDFDDIRATAGDGLPEVLPVTETKRMGLSKDWEVEYGESGAEGVDAANFAPPEFNGKEWQFSLGKLRDGAKVLMKQKGEVIAATHQFGEGQVVWLGSNWAYHINRGYSMDEARLWAGWFGEMGLFDGEKAGEETKYEAQRIKEGVWQVEGNGVKGILVKETNGGGWIANVKCQSSNVKCGRAKIYSAGPAAPGFVYIPLVADHTQEPAESIAVTVTWKGKMADKFKLLLMVILVGGGVVYLLVGRLIDPLLGVSKSHVHKKLASWWEKDHE